MIKIEQLSQPEHSVIKTKNQSNLPKDKGVISNCTLSPTQKKKEFGKVMDVPGDGNCRYNAVMALFRKMDIVDNNVFITMMRPEIVISYGTIHRM